MFMSSLGKIASYRILERIAEGGMAEVFLAMSQGVGKVNKFVAIKRVLQRHANNPELNQMFNDEAMATIQLRHSNIATVYDFGEEQGQCYLVMEFVDGKNVARFRQEIFQKRSQLPIQFALYIARETAAGLSYIHQFKDLQTGRPMNLIHRDLSPHNILIGREGDIKIIDFGVAKSDFSESKTSYGTIKGKLAYLSPEQLLYQHVDHRTDLFSLGVILWELLTNQRLFNLQVQEEYFNQLREFKMPDPRPLNSKIDDRLYGILENLLQLKPANRYASAQALHKDLNHYLNVHFPDFSSDQLGNYIRETLPEWSEVQQKYMTETHPNDATKIIDLNGTDRFVFRMKRTFRVVHE